jgi:hypothetical protein
MRIRYLYNMVLAVAAGFLVVVTQAFAPVPVAWLTFAIAVGATLFSAGMLVLPVGIVQRVLSGVSAIIGVWTIVASLVFAPTTVVWLGFASAIALVALAVGGLTVHELTTERVVHSLEVQRGASREPIAA